MVLSVLLGNSYIPLTRTVNVQLFNPILKFEIPTGILADKRNVKI